jgi:hypothetical protein
MKIFKQSAMKNICTFGAVALASLLIFSSCTDDLGPKYGLEVKLIALDENGIEGTIFEEGTNILLCIVATNNSKQEVTFRYPSMCEYYKYDEFLKVYKWVQFDDSGEKHLVPYGKSYYPHPCPDIDLYITIPPGEKRCLLGGSWNQDPSNSLLTNGRYYSSFSIDLPIECFSRKNKLEVEFEIN